jgi:iron complex outermembrane receptor protein
MFMTTGTGAFWHSAKKPNTLLGRAIILNNRLFIQHGRAVFQVCVVAVLLIPGMSPAQSADSISLENSMGQATEQPSGSEGKKLADLDIEQLARTPVVVPSMDIPVTSVLKEPSTVGHSPAAIFVITPEMIRRSGATCIPETLRMVPGIEVARITSNSWAITSRGFNDAYANKLLVLIDGRTVYTPVFSGVYWDTQDVLMEDIERIEVIRGPGGTLWGANAVNGVINVITKQAKNTQGAYVSVGGGTEEKYNSAFRYGGKIGDDDGYYRLYGKQFDRGTFYDPGGQPFDAWRQGRFGFRADLNLDRCKTNDLTVQGDHYLGASGYSSALTSVLPPYVLPFEDKNYVTGDNVLARLHHVCDEESDWTLQMYYDQYQRIGPPMIENVKTFDVDFQYHVPLSERQKITCGAGFRGVHDALPCTDAFTLYLYPVERTYNLTSQFIQDEINLVKDHLDLTLGTKMEQNAFTGFEIQPSARLLWSIDRRHSAWGAISRAIRTPSRGEENVIRTTYSGVPDVFSRIYGNPDIQSEQLMAYEAGYRAQATDKYSWDIAVFYNVYERLATLQPGSPFLETDPWPPHMIFPMGIINGASADTYGVELAQNWSITEKWRLYAQYTYLQVSMYDNVGLREGADPHNQVYLRSSWDLSRDLEFDLIGRYVDNLPYLFVPAYVSMDLRLAWRPRNNLEMTVVGQNLLQDQHLEFRSSGTELATQAIEVPRGVYGTVTYKY